MYLLLSQQKVWTEVPLLQWKYFTICPWKTAISGLNGQIWPLHCYDLLITIKGSRSEKEEEGESLDLAFIARCKRGGDNSLTHVLPLHCTFFPYTSEVRKIKKKLLCFWKLQQWLKLEKVCWIDKKSRCFLWAITITPIDCTNPSFPFPPIPLIVMSLKAWSSFGSEKKRRIRKILPYLYATLKKPFSRLFS